MGEKKYKAAGVIIKAEDTNKILLLKRSNVHHKFAGQWSIPAGEVENGEHPIDAVKRETLEEINISGLNNISYLVSLVNNKKNEKFDIYTASISTETTPTLDFEHTDFIWHDLNEDLPQPMGKHMTNVLQQQT